MLIWAERHLTLLRTCRIDWMLWKFVIILIGLMIGERRRIIRLMKKVIAGSGVQCLAKSYKNIYSEGLLSVSDLNFYREVRPRRHWVGESR